MLNYDIDISYVMPEAAFENPQHAQMLEASGIKLNSRGNYVAKFRDPNTAEALSGASEPVKDFFKACGFGFIPSGVPLPPGYFDSRFDNHLTDVIKRFQENIGKFDLKGQNWNGFEIGECLVAVTKAKPMEVMPPPTPGRKPSGGVLSRIFGRA